MILMTFISMHSIIICVVFSGAYMRCTRLCSLKPECDMYLAVYYLCRLQMPRYSSCPSPATNMYARLFPSPPALRNLGSGGRRGMGVPDLLPMVPVRWLAIA
jgi:hypothetical protein